MDTKVNARKRTSDEKPMCQYGASCYRKNPEHHKKFKHPPKNDTIDKYLDKNSLNDAQNLKNSEEKLEKRKDEKAIENSVTDAPVINDRSVKTSNKDVELEETVGEILNSMPKDFFDFWKFCGSLNKSKPEDAFLAVGYKLVGVFDLLSKDLPKDQKVDISCHWRYYYDPPEFQTVIMKQGKDLYHIGYFRDDPSEMPSVLASNKAADNSKLILMGDNIFCAMNAELCNLKKTSKSEKNEKKIKRIQEELKKFASKLKYSIDVQTSKTKQRQKKVNSKTFNGLGIVVPVKNDIGYRPLPDSNAVLKNILQKIVTAKDEEKRLEQEEMLDEIISNVHFANDECDYGMGLELGIDLFCYGDPYFHDHILKILPLAYELLKRPKYALIVKAHLKNRKKDENLSTL